MQIAGKPFYICKASTSIESVFLKLETFPGKIVDILARFRSLIYWWSNENEKAIFIHKMSGGDKMQFT